MFDSFAQKHPALKPLLRPPVLAAWFGGLLIFGAILLGTRSFLAFFSLGGLLIVGGGVIAVAFMSFEAEDVQKALFAIRTMLDPAEETETRLHVDMLDIVSWARLYREHGMRALETELNTRKIVDPFVRYGLNMVVSDYPADDIRAMMETAADADYERASVPVDILHAMASHGPAFGMIGTLVGMVALLCHLDANMASIGSSLAVAFLSTLYGVVSARMVYMPAAAKLEQKVTFQRFRNQLITEGMALLVGDKAPMVIQDRLNSFLRPESHDYYNVFRKALPQRTPFLKAVGS